MAFSPEHDLGKRRRKGAKTRYRLLGYPTDQDRICQALWKIDICWELAGQRIRLKMRPCINRKVYV
ncbi:hypothetical protein ACX3UO_01315, partial [Corynebacterium coyleae]